MRDSFERAAEPLRWIAQVRLDGELLSRWIWKYVQRPLCLSLGVGKLGTGVNKETLIDAGECAMTLVLLAAVKSGLTGG